MKTEVFFFGSSALFFLSSFTSSFSSQYQSGAQQSNHSVSSAKAELLKLTDLLQSEPVSLSILKRDSGSQN
jgi:hypothetical protein